MNIATVSPEAAINDELRRLGQLYRVVLEMARHVLRGPNGQREAGLLKVCIDGTEVRLGDAPALLRRRGEALLRKRAETIDKRCVGCRQIKPRTMFSRDRSTPDGLDHRCRDCIRERNRRYYARNRNEVKEAERRRREARRAANLERAA